MGLHSLLLETMCKVVDPPYRPFAWCDLSTHCANHGPAWSGMAW